MRELTVEEFLNAEAKRRGGLAFKFVPASFVGLPDRMVLLPRGRLGFLELKRPKKEPTPIQAYWLQWLVDHGFTAAWTDCHAGVQRFLDLVESSPS